MSRSVSLSSSQPSSSLLEASENSSSCIQSSFETFFSIETQKLRPPWLEVWFTEIKNLLLSASVLSAWREFSSLIIFKNFSKSSSSSSFLIVRFSGAVDAFVL